MSLSRLRGASILPPFPTDPDMWKKRSSAETLVHGNDKQGQETGLPVFCEPLQDADAKQCDYYADNSAKWIQPSGRIEMIDSAGDRHMQQIDCIRIFPQHSRIIFSRFQWIAFMAE